MKPIIKFSHLQDPTSWELSGPDRGAEIITCVTPGDAAMASALLNRLQDRAEKAEKDAERFRWLRRNRNVDLWDEEAIDAAMQASAAQEASSSNISGAMASGALSGMAALMEGDATRGDRLVRLVHDMNEAVLDTDASARPVAHLLDAWRRLQDALFASLPIRGRRWNPILSRMEDVDHIDDLGMKK